MSFDVFVQLVDEYYDRGFPRSIVVEAFGEFIGPQSHGVHCLQFPYQRDDQTYYGGGDLSLDDTPMINGFGVMGAGGHELYDVLYEIMRRVPGLYLYWPGGYVVSDASTIPLLPKGIEEALGPPPIVHSGFDITEAIRRAG